MNTRKRLDYFINLGLAGIAGLSGCVAAIITVGALLAGFALDNAFTSAPLFTVGCIVGSVPISLITMTVIVIRSAKTIEKRQYGN